MQTTSRDTCAEKRVAGRLVEIASQAALPTTDFVGTECDPSSPLKDMERSQREEGLANAITADDGISPDDAPEVGLDDINEEVCNVAP